MYMLLLYLRFTKYRYVICETKHFRDGRSLFSGRKPNLFNLKFISQNTDLCFDC